MVDAPTRRLLDPDELARLEEERDFLLRSLEDLQRERDAGDIDEHDHRELVDDYTARAAAIIRSIEQRQAGIAAAAPPRSPARTAVVLVLVAASVVAAVAFLFSTAEERRAGDPLTGEDVGETADEILTGADACRAIAPRDPEAIACWDDVLTDEPDDVEALTYRGWAHRQGDDLVAALADLDAAVAVDPDYPDARVFRASIYADQEQFTAARAELDTLDALDVADRDRELIDQLIADFGLRERVDFGLLPADVQACVDLFDGALNGEAELVESVECLDAIIAGQPGAVDARVFKAFVLAEASMSFDGEASLELAGDARALLEEAVALDPAHPDARLLLAALLDHTGDPAGAIAHLDVLAELAAPSTFYPPPEGVRAQAEQSLAATEPTVGPHGGTDAGASGD